MMLASNTTNHKLSCHSARQVLCLMVWEYTTPFYLAIYGCCSQRFLCHCSYPCSCLDHELEYVGRIPCVIKSCLPRIYPWRYTRDKIYQTLPDLIWESLGTRLPRGHLEASLSVCGITMSLSKHEVSLHRLSLLSTKQLMMPCTGACLLLSRKSATKPTPLLQKMLTCSTQAGSVVVHTVWKRFFLMSSRIMQLFYSKSSIMRALTNIDSACLKSAPAHLSVGCKIEEPMVSGKPTVTIHEKFFNYVPVVTGSDR